MKILIVTTLLLAVCFSKVIPKKVQTKEAWDDYNDPSALLENGFNKVFSSLPGKATLATKPWSDTYWPSYKGGIAARWAMTEGGDESDAFKYKLHPLSELKTMSQDQLKMLSPAEKFDIYRGLYDYPLVTEERGRTNPSCASWEGICHGWSPAALNFAEPSPVTLKNKDDIEVPFGSSDIKGLLDFYQGQVARGSTQFLANRCNFDKNSNPEKMTEPECRDINAGSFHIALTNMIGVNGKGFVADVTRDIQVWNQPVFSYTTQETSRKSGASEGAASGTVTEVTVDTTMTYGVEYSQSYNPIGTYNRTADYKYVVELNQAGEIIGGEWLKEQWDRPDFMWVQSRPEFTGEWSVLGEIFGASTGTHSVVLASSITSASQGHVESNDTLFVVLASVGTTLAAVLVVLGIVYAVVSRQSTPVSSLSALHQPLV